MFNLILLQVEGAAAQGGSPWSFWVILILILGGFMYLILARPFQKKEGKDESSTMASGKVIKSHGNEQSTGVVQNNQTSINVNNGSHLSNFTKILILYGIWMALYLTCLLARSDSSYGSTQLRDAFFWPFGRTDIFYYGNEEFVIYTIVLPIIVGLIYWAYKRNK